jgi:hypothetical protein
MTRPLSFEDGSSAAPGAALLMVRDTGSGQGLW